MLSTEDEELWTAEEEIQVIWEAKKARRGRFSTKYFSNFNVIDSLINFVLQF